MSAVSLIIAGWRDAIRLGAVFFSDIRKSKKIQRRDMEKAQVPKFNVKSKFQVPLQLFVVLVIEL
jgi:hypothetical protein